MKTINHEGHEYVLKSDMEAAFQSRIQKLSARAVQAEEQAKAYQEQLDNQSGELQKIQTLGSRVQELEAELENANSRYSRHTALADAGFQDPEIRELVEWQYERAMKGQEKKASLVDWLTAMKVDPSQAPVALRPHLKTETVTSSEVDVKPTQSGPEVDVKPTQSIPEPPVMIPPKTNTGTVQAPVQSSDMLKRATEDLDFYRANRESIKKAWLKR